MKYAKIRTAIKGHKDGQLSAPVLFNDFVALYARCSSGGKKVVVKSGDPAKRKKMEDIVDSFLTLIEISMIRLNESIL